MPTPSSMTRVQSSKTVRFQKQSMEVGTYSDFEGESCLISTLIGVDNTVHLYPLEPSENIVCL